MRESGQRADSIGPASSTAAWRLAVVIRVVGDVRRGGEGPDRAASWLSLRLSARSVV
jgi:hypothetical protein